MTEFPNNSTEQIFDATPYLRLFIDKDGRWFQNGAEIIHLQVYRQFYSMLEKLPDGSYRVRMGREVCKVEVEDAPFVVRGVLEDEHGGIFLELNDGSSESFNPGDFWIGACNIPYSYVKAAGFHARFSRAAYYQLARYIVQAAGEKEFCFLINGERFPVTMR